MVAGNKNPWSTFLASAISILEQTFERKISLETASQFFENSVDINNDELRDYFVNSIWEIDGFSDSYLELLKYMRTEPSPEALTKFIHQPPSGR